MKTFRVAALIACAFLAPLQADEAPATNRPAAWAQSIALAGAPNLHKLNDALYRSAQPSAEGMRNLERMGIRTVVNLRAFHSDRDEIGTSSLGRRHIRMNAWHPEKEDAVAFLRIVADTNNAPVLVHCLHGADRTGTMCALYRVAVDGWTKEDALREMTEGNFGFHAVWVNLPPWFRDLDIEAIKAEAGIATAEGMPSTGKPDAGEDNPR